MRVIQQTAQPDKQAAGRYGGTMPAPIDFDAHATRTFYDRISDAYDLISDAGEHAARQKGIELLNVQPGEKVLDVGYGTGSAVIELAQRAGKGGKVCGVDISPGMQRVAQQKVAAANVPADVQLDVGSALKMSYADKSFDAVYMSFTLELFPDDDIPVVLSECKRVLKPGGRLGVVAMATVLPGAKDSELEKTYKWTHRHFPHIVDCRPIDVEKVVQAAGFTMTSDVRLAIFTMPVGAVVARMK
jgi:demethylmenaquinone methyltransferase/2-methoxy-6-polyprenyl-1,4-benzoquinol methylase